MTTRHDGHVAGPAELLSALQVCDADARRGAFVGEVNPEDIPAVERDGVAVDAVGGARPVDDRLRSWEMSTSGIRAVVHGGSPDQARLRPLEGGGGNNDCCTGTPV